MLIMRNNVKAEFDILRDDNVDVFGLAGKFDNVYEKAANTSEFMGAAR